MIRKECLVAIAKQKATQAVPLYRIILGGLALVSCWPLTAFSAYQTLDQLLNEVRQEHAAEQAENRKREQRFIEARDQQQALLSKAKHELAKEEAHGRTIKQEYDANEKNIDVKLDALEKTQGALGELHGIVRQVAGDLKGTVESSLVSAQLPGRVDFLRDLSESKELPSIDELEQLWHSMLEQMVESGKVVKFKAKAITSSGDEQEQQVTRVGTFNAVAQGQFLRYLPETGRLLVPSRQPPPRLQRIARDFENSNRSIHPIPVDPTRGAMLALLVQKPNLVERIQQGGVIGYVIIALGVIGLILALQRVIALAMINRRIRQQLVNEEPNSNNPLGRIMKVYEEDPQVDHETLGLKLDEAVLREMPAIQSRLATLGILAAVAPLLGLLGTVTGIIETFQSITLFGTGDPRLMSGGISQALVTTVLGLSVAIPILLLHSVLTSNSNRLIQILDEQSASIVARLAAQRHA